jgi:hypothetical protein
VNPENPDTTFFSADVERWKSREEIRREYLDSLSPEELRQVNPADYWVKYGRPAFEREQARKYDPNQPRVPAGNPDGGQWTGGGADSQDGDDLQPANYLLAPAGAQSAAYCWNQLTIDNLYCGALRPSSVVAACRSQAMQRYAACLTGKSIPPLPF